MSTAIERRGRRQATVGLRRRVPNRPHLQGLHLQGLHLQASMDLGTNRHAGQRARRNGRGRLLCPVPPAAVDDDEVKLPSRFYNYGFGMSPPRSGCEMISWSSSLERHALFPWRSTIQLPNPASLRYLQHMDSSNEATSEA